jgi:hypothetical protein
VRLYLGAALLSAVAYAVGLALPDGTGQGVCGIAAIFFLFSTTMVGVELIQAWRRDRAAYDQRH